MSSAASNVETRMKAFNEMGIKIQTFQKVMTSLKMSSTIVIRMSQKFELSLNIIKHRKMSKNVIKRR